MKPIFWMLLALLLGENLSAQTLLHDAMVLNSSFTEPTAASANRAALRRGVTLSEEQLLAIHRYLPDSVPFTPEAMNDALDEAFAGNPFLRMEVTDANLAGIGRLEMLGGSQSARQSASGFSVAGFADGLSRFLVKRTKQELSQAFFTDFKEKMRREPVLDHFCPATKMHLELIDQDVYQFNKYLESLREAFTADMSALPGNTENYLRDELLCVGCADKTEGKIMIDFLHLAQQMVDGEAPIHMIDYLARSESAIQTATTAQPVLYDMANSFRFLQLVSESMRNPDSKHEKMPWYNAQEVREMFADPKLFRIYLGLLWQKSNNIAFLNASGGSIGMQNILRKASDATDAGKNLFDSWRRSLGTLGEGVHSMQRSVRAGTEGPHSGADDFFRYSQSLHELMQSVNEIGRVVLDQPKGKELIPEEYIFYMGQCNSLYCNARRRNYTGAISNVIFVLSKIGRDKKEIQTMLKYANFVASIAEANSPEEVERALELFALPPGSSQMKKQPGRFALAINAYTGLAGGSEYLNGEMVPKTFGAITAPVGLSFSWGLGVKKEQKKTGELAWKNWGSLGFFVPLLDVGAVTAFRFKDSQAQDLPELTWGNILSPGLYAVYDFPSKWPIAVGYGAQIGPSLRKVTELGLEKERSGWRHGFFATVDIPIAYFYLGKGRK